ncbi:hypothetical protein HY632_04135 [Candidatus Uhrbacteria bacterium]|nr:hypothetical protein [Candidatus Uhrbacteria bacterium]
MRRIIGIVLLLMLVACEEGGCFDPEAMSGDVIGRMRLAERAQQSTRDIQRIDGELKDLRERVAKVEERCRAR